MNAIVTALGSVHPLANRMRRIEVPAGLTIREIVAIDCLPLIRQYGSLHCVTMQLPAGTLAPL